MLSLYSVSISVESVILLEIKYWYCKAIKSMEHIHSFIFTCVNCMNVIVQDYRVPRYSYTQGTALVNSLLSAQLP